MAHFCSSLGTGVNGSCFPFWPAMDLSIYTPPTNLEMILAELPYCLFNIEKADLKKWYDSPGASKRVKRFGNIDLIISILC